MVVGRGANAVETGRGRPVAPCDAQAFGRRLGVAIERGLAEALRRGRVAEVPFRFLGLRGGHAENGDRFQFKDPAGRAVESKPLELL